MTRPDLEQANPPRGEWLYKLHDDILGPVPSTDIIELMFSGEVDESTEVALGESRWRPVQAFPAFHPFLYQAKVKIRAELARAEALAASKKRRMIQIIKISLGACALVLVSFMVSYFMIVSRPRQIEDQTRVWADKHVPLLAIGAILPQTTRAEEETEEEADEEDDGEINVMQILIDDAPALVAIGSGAQAAKGKSTSSKKKFSRSSSSDKKTQSSPSKGTKTAMGGSLSNAEIMAVVNKKSNLRMFYGCIKKELRANSDLPSNISMGFTINNDGRVGRVRMDDVRLQNSSLHKCFRVKLSKVRFRAYTGERRNVELPFNIGSR